MGGGGLYEPIIAKPLCIVKYYLKTILLLLLFKSIYYLFLIEKTKKTVVKTTVLG